MEAFFGDHGVDAEIVRLDRYRGKYVPGVEHAYELGPGAHAAERLVVIAAAAAEAPTVEVDCHGRDENGVGLGNHARAQRRALWLGDPEAPGGELGGGIELGPVEGAGLAGHGEEHADAGVVEHRGQVRAAGLAERGDERADGGCGAERGDVGEEDAADLGVVGEPQILVDTLAPGADRGADLAFRVGRDGGGVEHPLTVGLWGTAVNTPVNTRCGGVARRAPRFRCVLHSYAVGMTFAGSPNGNAQFATAVVPAAGLGTRFLPATKTVPKELLPVVDTPGIELIAEEAAAAGAGRLAIVTSERKVGVMAHFSEDPTLEGTLEKRGKDVLLHKVKRAPGLIEVESVRQERPLGLGHAIGLVEQILDDSEDAVAVLLPDDLVLPMGVLERMSEVRRQHGGTVLCAFEVPEDQVSSYGVFATEDTDDSGVKKVTGMVEKPAVEDAPSNLAAAGRYLLDRAIFDALREIGPGAGGEYQVTDAIALLIEQGHPVHVVVHDGPRHDLGNPGGYIKACVDFALRSDAYGADLREWLGERLQD